MIELLAPAGDLEKLKIAILYGADAVYIGGKKFSLRARASNFTSDDIKEACRFARERGAKVYVTVNIVPHNEDMRGFADYARELAGIGVNGAIVTSLEYAAVARRVAPELEIHLSTQASVANSRAANFYKSRGFSRIVLARELTLEQIKRIKENTDIELEVFIHGGMCVAYSGRCVLSNYLAGRDANRGGCAHSCRWRYFFDEPGGGEFLMGSKDLSGLRAVGALIDSGVKSLKIEGRMKSVHYIATVVRAYRRLIDEYLKNGEIADYAYYESELAKAENRETGSGFFFGHPGAAGQLYAGKSESEKTFVGIVRSYDSETGVAVIEQRNYFAPGDALEFFGPRLANARITVGDIWDEEGRLLDAARHPRQIIRMKVPFPVRYPDMIRLAD
jgi:putative protease